MGIGTKHHITLTDALVVVKKHCLICMGNHITEATTAPTAVQRWMVMGMRRHSTATLMGMTKKELVEYVRMAEHNQDVADRKSVV